MLSHCPAQPFSPGKRPHCFPLAPAWLRDTQSPGREVTRPHRIHLQPHQLPGNRIPAADDSLGLQDRAPIQPLPKPAWPDLVAASPTWALPRLGTGLQGQPALPRLPAMAGDRGLGRAPPWVPRTAVRVDGEGAREPAPPPQSLSDSRQPEPPRGPSRLNLKGAVPAGAPSYCTHFIDVDFQAGMLSPPS